MKEVGKEEGGLYLLIKHLTTQYNDQEKEVGAAFAANDFKETNMVYGIEDWVMYHQQCLQRCFQ